MINSSSTIKIDGVLLDNKPFVRMFSNDKHDRFSRWVIRPIAVITALALSAAVLLASAFLAVLSLAMIPLLAVGYWAVKTKLERDLATSDTESQPQDSTSKKTAIDA